MQTSFISHTEIFQVNKNCTLKALSFCLHVLLTLFFVDLAVPYDFLSLCLTFPRNIRTVKLKEERKLL